MISKMRYDSLGNLIRKEREKRGWEQAELATTLSVTQQTVSRWEKGSSRPQQSDLSKLVDIFSGDIEEWSEKAGYSSEGADSSLTPTLPLQNLSEEKFEFFSRDLIKALNPSADVNRYGTKGHKQEGIDLLAKTGKTILDYQCKRQKQFGPADIDEAVKITTFKANHHHILLSRIASPSARKQILKYDDWTLWDKEDISREIRSLPNKDEAVRIVDIYFPGWRKKFLGVDEPSPWLSPTEFYLPLADKMKLFSHGWGLVGRQKELNLLNEFRTQDKSQAIIISGRGGVGKSRLLREWSEKVDKTVLVRFVSPGSEIEPKDIELLPQGPSYLIIDDAHDRSDILVIIGGVIRFRPEMKVILSARPYGVTHLENELSKSGIACADNTINLGDLDVNDAKSLAEEILKDVSEQNAIQYAQRIAEITKDCPLATVIGSRLVGEGAIKPDLLNNEKRFREKLFSTFRDVVAGEIGVSTPTEIKDLLDFIAMIQPINTSDQQFQEAAKKILDRHFDRILRDISALEDAGVLLRRGNRLRIVPDLLADFMRAEASYDENSGKPTGYADRVFELVQNESAKNLLVNLSQLDWRLAADGLQPMLLNDIWKKITDEVIGANNASRCEILKALKDIAYYQPTQVLELVEFVKDNPATEPENPEFERIYKYTHGHVLAELPEILRRIGYNLEFLPRCADLLWEISRGDTRRTNSNPDHGIRVLKDLAQYDIYELTGKSVQVNKIMLDAVKRWLKDPKVHEYTNSPLDILDEFLEKEGNTDTYDKGKITFHSFAVNFESTKALRDEALKLIIESAYSPHLKLSLRAIKSLHEALSEPRELYGRQVTEQEQDKWKPFQLEVLDALDKISKKQNHPIIQLEIKDSLPWQVKHSKSTTIKEKARSLFEKLSKPFENRLLQALESPHDRDWFLEEEDYNYEKVEKINLNFRQDVVNEFVKKYPNPKDGFKIINNLLSEMESCNTNFPFPITFFSQLAKLHTKYALDIAQEILANPDSTVSSSLGYLLFGLVEKDLKLTTEIASNAIAIGNEKLITAVADYYWRRGWVDSYGGETDLANLKLLLRCRVHFAKKMAISCIGRLAKAKPEIAKELLLSLELEDNKVFADEYCAQFDKTYHFDPDTLSDKEVNLILDKLVSVTDIDDHHIEELLEEFSKRMPRAVVHFLTKRIDISKKAVKTEEGTDKFRPFSYTLTRHFVGVQSSPDYLDILRDLRNKAAEDDWQTRFWYPLLFKAISANFGPPSIDVLMEWVRSGEKKKIEIVGILIKEVPDNFVFQNPQFVTDMLRAAEPFGEKFLKSTMYDLASPAMYGSKQGVVGQPMPQDVALKENSLKMMDRYPKASLEYSFYELLAKHATKEIQEQMERDEDLF